MVAINLRDRSKGENYDYQIQHNHEISGHRCGCRSLLSIFKFNIIGAENHQPDRGRRLSAACAAGQDIHQLFHSGSRQAAGQVGPVQDPLEQGLRRPDRQGSPCHDWHAKGSWRHWRRDQRVPSGQGTNAGHRLCGAFRHIQSGDPVAYRRRTFRRVPGDEASLAQI